ncbi:TlpA family protein disulfide reductase [Nocardioides panaciterrulae]|uniref:Thiol-disulfide isomerase/thioredoxin n=1 Tax=Nocardioides panaciterrulae TaxID=661492 RepID=A0A7Y9JAJ0_9ACTN|nr:TlpA disulfide reductase family protein [Nocardioides panaciterrulae]NYD41151.1 thiol-disulfide isomerase/thioredoxin [Nocardioides panaciterrulae]
MRRLVRVTVLAGALAAALAGGTACSAGLETPASHSALGAGAEVFPAGERAAAPQLRGTTLTGDELDLADLLGHGPVAVNVWASWCDPCRREMPVLARASSRVRVLGIDERDDRGAARAFAASRGAAYPSLSDADGTLLASLAMLPQNAVPSTLFLDERGRVAARVVGPVDADVLRRVLRRLGGSS